MMRLIEIILLFANLLAFFSLVIPLQRSIKWVQYLAFVPLPITGVQVLVEGSRWGMIPAYIMSGILFVAWLAKNIVRKPKLGGTSKIRRLVSGFATGLGALGLIVSSALPILFPVFHLPQPSGPNQIGTLTYHWVDKTRPEIFTDNPNDRREIMVQIWYPAKGNLSSPYAPYIQETDSLASLAHLSGFPGFIFDQFKYVQTHAIPSATVSTDESKYPVLIFSAGRGGFRQESTHMFEELASHGYIVASIDHPYTSSGVVFPDGRLISLDSRLLPGPQSGIPADRKFFDNIVIPYLAKDVIFALDQLTALNQSDPRRILTGRLDLKNVGMFGPSMGGLVGAEASYLDPRFRAFIAMDVHMPANVVRSGLKQPTMFISREAKWMKMEGWSKEDIDKTQITMRSVYKKLPKDGYLVLIPGTFHVNFSDAPFFSPLMSWAGLTGPIDGDRANNIIDSYTLAFFDKYLKSQPAKLLDGPSKQYPEVHFEKR
ncbi:hypothetical protein MUG84_23395 [Paenibacillus sp. KQZ6P-2]|uniref:Carboxylic ester hydrolase n=1 Tax=Paenibacillus mangrovi TaxID=2931978 RepID=A0A9X1WVF9_9BACL|nr:hypothetical protein [Paenibacillus mangrovi]MCJ8014635.1 hypothetical protein [Paenibacillus mangrovi]